MERQKANQTLYEILESLLGLFIRDIKEFVVDYLFIF